MNRSAYDVFEGTIMHSYAVAEGYASGKVVQYEIEAANGDRFMASEQELQPQ